MSKSQPIFIYGIVIKEERGIHKNCQLCNAKFTLTVKEHQCKRCKRAVCEKCAMNKAHVQKGDSVSKKPHRLCNFCKDETDQMKRFLDQYKIQFNSDTISQQWLAAFGTDTLKAKNVMHLSNQDFYNAQESGTTSDAYDTLKAKLEVVINDIDGCINYSMREFMMGALRQIESFRQKEVVKNSILKVAGTLLLKYPQIGYSHELILITYLLLCFCSEASAYVLLTIIYSQIIPSQLYPRNQNYDMVNEFAIVNGVLKDALLVNVNDLNVMKSYIKEKLKRFIVCLTVNMFLFETTFFIWNSMFLSGGYMDLLSQMAVLCAASSQEMQKNKYAHEETELYMLRNLRNHHLSALSKQTQNCDMESYKKVYITSRSESIRVENLSNRTSAVKPDVRLVSEINQKLQEQVEKREKEITLLNQQLLSLKEQVKQLQKENSYLQNKSDNSEAELYKIKLHEARIDNSDLKQQVEQLKKQISQQTDQNAQQSVDSDDEIQLKKYEQQVRNLQRQAAEKKSQSQQEEINQLKKQAAEEIRELKNQIKQLQQKLSKQEDNDEVELLTELNEELTKQNENLTRELHEIKSVGGASTNQLIKTLREENQQLQQQIKDNESVYRELIENLNKVPGNKPQIYEFSDQKLGGRHDIEDAKKVVEIKTVQNQILKGLLKENQNYLIQMSQTMAQFRQILNRSKY